MSQQKDLLPVYIGQISEAIFLSALATKANGITPCLDHEITERYNSVELVLRASRSQHIAGQTIYKRTYLERGDVFIAHQTSHHIFARYSCKDLMIVQGTDKCDAVIYLERQIPEAILTAYNRRISDGEIIKLEDICKITLPSRVAVPNLPVCEIKKASIGSVKITIRDLEYRRPWENVALDLLAKAHATAKAARCVSQLAA